ncbi:MAG: hypothetical protein ACFHWZ_18395 [Phycisphaerales bacterium]
MSSTFIQPGIVEPETPCLGCRYDLGGLEPTGQCPECALPIAETVEWRWLGLDPLVYRRQLATASTLVWSAALGLLLLILAFALVGAVLLFDDALLLLPTTAFSWMPLVLITVELAIGWWFLSAPSPMTRDGRGRDGMHRPRAIARVFVLASTILALGGISLMMLRLLVEPGSTNLMLHWVTGPGAEVGLGIVFLATVLGALGMQLTGVWYLTRLATRLDADSSQYNPGSLALGLRQTGWLPVYTLGFGVLAVVLYPVAILMVGFFGIVPITWAVVTVTVVPGALLFALARSTWLVARFGRRVRRLNSEPNPSSHGVHSGRSPIPVAVAKDTAPS